MKYYYETPALEILMLEMEQCILSESNSPAFEPGTDLDELLD